MLPLYVETEDDVFAVTGIETNGGTYGIRLQCDSNGPTVAELEKEIAEAEEKKEICETAITDAMQALKAFEAQYLDGDVPPPPTPLVEALEALREKIREHLDEYCIDL